jgi:hypothetical protein
MPYCHGDIVRVRGKTEEGASSWADSQVGKIVGLNAIFLNVFILIGSVFESSSMHLLLRSTCYCKEQPERLPLNTATWSEQS